MIRFSIPGRPIPTARPRVLRTGRTYMPKRTVAAQRAVGEAALAATGGKRPLYETEALYVGIQACFPYAKGTPKSKIEKGWVPMPVGPDVDNLSKTVLDGCLGIVYADDSQVVELTISKHRVENPSDVGFHIEISVE